jgi:hypothetical protein
LKFIDQLYQLYKDKLTGDEEDVYIIVEGVFSDFQRKDYINLLTELSNEQLEEMVAYYMVELLRRKIADEGLGHVTMDTDIEGNLLH